MEETGTAPSTSINSNTGKINAEIAGEEEVEDKISSLPDEILCQILSSFQTKEAVRTSILSKRWRYVWISVPNLDFSDDTFVHIENRDKLEIKDCFKDFVNRVLHLNNVSSIRKSCFYCYRDYGLSCVNSWIQAILRRNVEEISLRFAERHQVLLPSDFFTREKLVVLKLGPNITLNVPASVHFPNLKILRLDEVEIADDNVMESLLSGCPVLENFHLRRKRYYNLHNLHNLHNLFIRSSSLTLLRVESGEYCYVECYTEYKIVVETPNLEYLHVDDEKADNFHVIEVPSSCRVNLGLGGFDAPYGFDCVSYNDRLIKVLGMISNTMYVQLHDVFLEFINESYYGSLPVFHNLSCLEMTFNMFCWGIWPYLLESSPNLKTFILEKNHIDDNYTLCKWVQPGSVPKCLLFCLQRIEIITFGAYLYEKEMVEYFLTNGRVLKEMSISFAAGPKLKSEYQKELLKLPKASSKCEVSFS